MNRARLSGCRDRPYVDAQALNLVRQPWKADRPVMENMFGDIFSDLASGMSIAACAENGCEHGLFQPTHGRALDIIGQNHTNPLAALLSVALMLDYLAEKSPNGNTARPGG